jgi:hypothetical protein
MRFTVVAHALCAQVSLVKQAFAALCVNEFSGLRFQGEGPGSMQDGQQVGY